MDLTDTITAITTVVVAVVTVITAWHAIVIAPLKSSIDAMNKTNLENSTRINSLQVDHAVLATTMENLRIAIERLADRLDKQ